MDTVSKHRGRPKGKKAINLERKLKEEGTVGIRYGDAVGVQESTARMRLYNAGRSIGAKVSVNKKGKRLIATVEQD